LGSDAMWWYPGGAFVHVSRSNHIQGNNSEQVEVYPKAYLQASFEVFIFMLVVCWIATCIGNYSVIDSNRIADVFGYNNVCVGFDTAPARYFAQPLMCLQAFFGMRYVNLDGLRAELEQQEEGAEKGKAYYFTKVVNFCYVITMLLWGMLLIVLPEGDSFAYHFYIYAIFVVVMYLTILANYFEEYLEAGWDRIRWWQAVWVVSFGIESVLLLGIGMIGFNGYDYDQCPNNSVNDFKQDGRYDQLCLQDPYIPVALMAPLDYGWFFLLFMSPWCLPESRPLLYAQISLAAEATQGNAGAIKEFASSVKENTLKTMATLGMRNKNVKRGNDDEVEVEVEVEEAKEDGSAVSGRA